MNQDSTTTDSGNSTDTITPAMCPRCGTPMQCVFKHGVMADICPDHGLWLDNGELEKILSRIRVQEQNKAKVLASKERHRGSLLGPAMVFLDDFLMGK